MSELTQEEPRTAELVVNTDERMVTFRHGLGGDVIVRAYGSGGQPVGYEAAFDIDGDEVEVMVIPGSVHRLTAELAPPEDE